MTAERGGKKYQHGADRSCLRRFAIPRERENVRAIGKLRREQKRLTSGNKMESIRYASKQVNKPPTRTHHDSLAGTFLSTRALANNAESYHVLAPFFFLPPFPSIFVVFFFFVFLFSYLYRLTSYERMTRQRCFVHEHRLTILSLVALLGSWRERGLEKSVVLYGEK